MAAQRRRRIVDPQALAALAHPLRLDLLEHLMASGPATASACARAVGDTPSNCSYHLRTLARVGLVREAHSEDGRERPWEALITGFDTGSAEGGEPASPEEADLMAISLQRDQRLMREYLARRDRQPRRWREADVYSTYTLRLTPEELAQLDAQLDGLIRPYLAATRERAPGGSGLVRLALQAFPVRPS